MSAFQVESLAVHPSSNHEREALPTGKSEVDSFTTQTLLLTAASSRI